MGTRLGETEIIDALATCPGWRRHGVSIARDFAFRDSADAFALMTRVALAAGKADHHPDWSNSCNRVDIRLTTHAAGGLTPRDFTLARIISAGQSSLQRRSDRA